MDDPYLAHDARLRYVHAHLLGLLCELERAPAHELAPKTVYACRATLFHHHAESTGLFPLLRRTGRLRSADVSFLDVYDREHQALYDLAQRLLAQGEALHLDRGALLGLASELASQFERHAHDEELGLAPARLCTMIGREELEAFGREAASSVPNS